ncbi:MAG: RloB family protein [Lewinella sp.]
MAREKKPSGLTKKNRRNPPRRKPDEVFYLVGEGESTEKFYFESFSIPGTLKVDYKSYTRSAQQLVEKAVANSKDKNYSEVWVVFDLDYNPARGDEQYAEFTKAIQYAIKHSIKVAYSIDSFEIWFRLHYENITTRIAREQLYDDLSRRWETDYEQYGKEEAFARELAARLENDPDADRQEAITRAKNLHEKYKALPYREQPSMTTVYRLVHNLTTPRKKDRYK